MFSSGNAFTQGLIACHALATRPMALSSLALAMSPALCAAGLVGGGVVHTWDGSVNTSWHTTGNWNTNAVPGAGDTAHILGGPSNVFLNADSQNLASLLVSGGRSLSNNGHSLSVIDTVATTTVSGLDSTLFITDSSDPYGFQTGWLTVQSNGRLQMAGGTAMVNAQLTLSSGGRITGHGYVYVHENAPAAFNAANGSDITVSGGDLTLGVISGGSIALAPTINVTSPGLTLNVSGPMFLPVEDINVGNGSAFSSENNWTLDGTLTANPGSGNTSFVEGDGSMTVEGHVSVANNGRLRLLSQVNFEPASTTFIGMGSTLEIDGGHSVDAGHVTTIQPNGRLQLDGVPSVFGWEGDIVSSGGVIESNNALSVGIEGDITLGSFGGLRTTLNGTSSVRAYGSVTAPGLGAIVNGIFDLRSTATMSLNTASTALMVNGDLILRTDSTSSGDGAIQVNAGGSMLVQPEANISVDVVNGGDFEAGDNTARVLIDVNAPFSQSATGRLNIDLGSGGVGVLSSDQIAVWDDAALAGTLNIRLAGGFTPEEGAEFVILTANNVSGTFASLTGAPGFSVTYLPDEIVLNYDGVGLFGDVTGDGLVNIDDLLAVVAAWGVCPPPPVECPADIVVNGQVDIDDLLAVISNWTP